MGFSSNQLASASLIGQIGGGVTSAIGSYYSAATQKATMQGQAAVADVNARIADANASAVRTTAGVNARIAELGAQSVLLQGQQQVGALTLKAGQLKSSQRASLAANGVDLGSGNAAEIQASTDIMSEIDRNTLEANAVRSAWGYRAQATNFENEAITAQSNGWAYRADAANKRTTSGAISPFGSAAGSLLGSASSVAGSWYSLNKSGALKGTIFEG